MIDGRRRRRRRHKESNKSQTKSERERGRDSGVECAALSRRQKDPRGAEIADRPLSTLSSTDALKCVDFARAAACGRGGRQQQQAPVRHGVGCVTVELLCAAAHCRGRHEARRCGGWACAGGQRQRPGVLAGPAGALLHRSECLRRRDRRAFLHRPNSITIVSLLMMMLMMNFFCIDPHMAISCR